MDKQEFATLAMAIRTYYPKENILPNKEAMQLWFRELHDIPYNVAEAALRKWVSTNKWSPSIAEIREMAANIQNGDITINVPVSTMLTSAKKISSLTKTNTKIFFY